MSDEVFRIVIAAGVALASIAFIVQAAIVFAIYRGSRKMEDKTFAFMGRIEPMIMKVGPALDKAGPILDEVGPVIKRLGPVMEKTGVVLDKVPAVIDKVQVVVGQAGVLIQRGADLAVSVDAVVASTNNILLDARPQLNEISAEAMATVRNAREHVERLGDLLQDAGDLARTRIQQIDKAVTSTVEQVEQVGDTVKSAVMRPVREVNGLAAGISAAVSTLVRGQRKSSVDAATQDEEMFI